MEIVQSKSLLAKLMATENLIVEQRNVSTASFDVKARILTVPVLDSKISPQLYDLFMGHEVGHALYTPLDGLYKARDLKISMSVMNVLEDVRIERKIKYKYPGIRTSFVRGYKELIQKDFFGTEGVDLNELNFIDRINMHTKAGAGCNIKFSDEERDLLNETESTETYDDVIEVAKKVMIYLTKEKEERTKQNPVTPDDELDELDDDELDEAWQNPDDENGYGDEEDDSGTSDNTDMQDEDGDVVDKTKIGNKSGKTGNDDIESHTDNSYHENENKLFAQSSRNYYYGNIPDIDLNKHIVDHKILWRQHQFCCDTDSYTALSPEDFEKFQKIRRDANKVVSYLAREFEMKKNAEQMKKATTAKSGDLNMDKIFSYKFNEDIFKKLTVVPNGKSHGLVMFLDWSGSMANNLESTIKQLINLVMFCKKVNIPYEVYAFTSEYEHDKIKEFVDGDIKTDNFVLMNMLSSRMSSIQFTYACTALVYMSSATHRRPRFMYLGGTPLNEAIIAAMKIVPKFQKQNKLQVVNAVFFTDGEGQIVSGVYYTSMNMNGEKYRQSGKENSSEGRFQKDKKLILRDPITKNQEIVSDYRHRAKVTASYIKLLKARTNCNILGFYSLTSREFSRSAGSYFPSLLDFDKLKADFRKNKYQVATPSGYDEYYFVKAEGLDTEEDVELVVKENATTRGLVSAFSKYAGGRLGNRVILNRFIDMIS